MAGQVAGEHRKTHLQAPVDHVPVQPHVIVIPMQNQQTGVRLLGPPGLGDDIVVVHAKASETPLHLPRCGRSSP